MPVLNTAPPQPSVVRATPVTTGAAMGGTSPAAPKAAPASRPRTREQPFAPAEP
jgi:hypothetical protein